MLVEDVLRADFAPPYPPNIIDQVCVAIETDPDRLRRYHTLAAELGGGAYPAEWKVNNAIGWWVKDVTGMVTVKADEKATSKLIKNYSRLEYADLSLPRKAG